MDINKLLDKSKYKGLFYSLLLESKNLIEIKRFNKGEFYFKAMQ